MIKNLLTAAAFALLATGSAFAQQEATVVKFADVADTWLRSSSENETSRGTADKLEFRKEAIYEGEGDEKQLIGYHDYVGLLGFEYNLPAGMKVSKATLYFVTERFKGSKVTIQGYANDFAENASWKQEAGNIEAAFATEPLYVGDLAGQWNKAAFDNGLTEDKRNLAAWSNAIDVTEYVKTVRGTRVNFIFSQQDVDNAAVTNQNCIYSKENNGLSNTNYPEFVASAEDLVPYLEVVFVEDANQSEEVLGAIADTQIRKNNTTNYGGNGNMEIKTTADGQEFYGLLEFKLPSEVLDQTNYTLNSAVLRLVCCQNKGSRPMNLFVYGNSVVENTTFADEQAHVTEALASEPVASFEAKGQGTKAMGDDGITEAYSTAEAWTSYIDLTDYINSLGAARSVTSGNVAFLLAKEGEHNDAMRFATKEATDITSRNGYTFPAADLYPQLTVNYSKKTSTGIEEITVVEDENAPVEYYNLSGMRVSGDNLTPGVYVKRQGAKAVKVYVK